METDRQTDRDSDGETNRDRDGETESKRQTDRHTEMKQSLQSVQHIIFNLLNVTAKEGVRMCVWGV